MIAPISKTNIAEADRANRPLKTLRVDVDAKNSAARRLYMRCTTTERPLEGLGRCSGDGYAHGRIVWMDKSAVGGALGVQVLNSAVTR
jgi:hypothetical protein